MAAASITFTDGTGAVTVSNGKPQLADRFSNWTPLPVKAASRVVGLGTGTHHEWVFRTDYGATFELRHIPVSELPDLSRLKIWLEAGNSVTVNTGDASSNSYTVKLFPDSEVSWEMTDPALLEYTLYLRVKNTAAAPLTCAYGATSP